MPERSSPTSETNREFIPPMGSSGKKLDSFQGKVEIPPQERPWATQLAEVYKRLDYDIQKKVIDIIKNLRTQNPEKAVEIAHKIGDFFNRTGDYGKTINIPVGEFLEQLEDELNSEINKKIN